MTKSKKTYKQTNTKGKDAETKTKTMTMTNYLYSLIGKL